VSRGAPSVTIVIPTRDRWRLMAATSLKAALAQEGVELEVVVVDDGSAEPAPEGLRGLDDPRARVVRHETSRGVAAARNAGIAAAQGEWVAFLDDDDFWAPQKLRRQLEAAGAAGADFAYSGVVSVDGGGAVLHEYPVPAPEELLRTCAIPAGPSNVLVRTELVRAVGGFDEQLAHLADWDCWIRIAWSGRAAVAPEILVAYLEHFEGMSLLLPHHAFDELVHLERKHEQLLAEQGVEIDRVAFAHYVAWLQLRRRKRLRAARVYLRSGVENRRLQDVRIAARFVARALVPVQRRHEAAPIAGPAWLALYR
jgi:glycosyltransferase involved in cell wall biosynthesis